MAKGNTTTTRAATENRADIYQRITDRIVAAIEAGAGDWRMPWHSGANGAASVLPRNVASGRAYRGVNTLMLWAAAQQAGFSGASWATYRQWQELGAQVRKGEHATPIVFWSVDGKPEPEEVGRANDEDRPARVIARGYSVFNVAQVDGYIPTPAASLTEPERIEHAEAFFAATGAEIRHGGNRACYVPKWDSIVMPPFAVFRDPVAYYATLAHEATHWTGHPVRCSRDLRGRFGDEAYAAEELVAELGAAFLCADLALAAEPRPDHAAYVASWLRVLRGDKRAIFTAAAKAQSAVDWMQARQQISEEIGFNVPSAA